MMNDQLKLDAVQYPQQFAWRGAIPRQALLGRLHSLGISAPDDVIDLWEWSGGGDLYESETILDPMTDGHDESLVDVNAWLHAEGLPSKLIAFQRGFFWSAFCQADGSIVTFDPDTKRIRGVFPSLDVWYRDTIRSEFGGLC